MAVLVYITMIRTTVVLSVVVKHGQDFVRDGRQPIVGMRMIREAVI